jgi:hypothetical protein
VIFAQELRFIDGAYCVVANKMHSAFRTSQQFRIFRRQCAAMHGVHCRPGGDLINGKYLKFQLRRANSFNDIQAL